MDTKAVGYFRLQLSFETFFLHDKCHLSLMQRGTVQVPAVAVSPRPDTVHQDFSKRATLCQFAEFCSAIGLLRTTHFDNETVDGDRCSSEMLSSTH